MVCCPHFTSKIWQLLLYKISTPYEQWMVKICSWPPSIGIFPPLDLQKNILKSSKGYKLVDPGSSWPTICPFWDSLTALSRLRLACVQASYEAGPPPDPWDREKRSLISVQSNYWYVELFGKSYPLHAGKKITARTWWWQFPIIMVSSQSSLSVSFPSQFLHCSTKHRISCLVVQ